jgi:hypothetical protein
MTALPRTMYGSTCIKVPLPHGYVLPLSSQRLKAPSEMVAAPRGPRADGIGGRRRQMLRAGGPGGSYQACPAPQCGHITVVETFAWNSSPHSQL